MNMIDVQSLRVDYNEVSAVQDLSLEIPQGQIYGFVGPNGAGKTSTIKALAGILEPTYGRIQLAGFDLELHRERALSWVGYMPDFAPVYEALKVWEYLDVFAAAYGIPAIERERKVNEWLSKVDLMGKKDSLIKGLSRGMRQRIVFAKTLLPQPKILLLDEPASGLDPMARRQMRDLLKEAATAGTTVFISSHILAELSDFCDAIGILEKGRLVVSGALEEISAAIGCARTLHVRFSSEGEAPQAFWDVLTEFQINHDDVLPEKGHYIVKCHLDDNASAEFLKRLIHWGAPVTDYYSKTDDVEEIFFKIGAKEVA